MELGVYEKNISYIQNLVWRLILKNLNHILKSKGTKESIKQVFRSAGIEPDRLFRMVEFGGKKEFRLGKSRQKIIEMSNGLIHMTLKQFTWICLTKYPDSGDV